jgi:hypothetical protein
MSMGTLAASTNTTNAQRPGAAAPAATAFFTQGQQPSSTLTLPNAVVELRELADIGRRFLNKFGPRLATSTSSASPTVTPPLTPPRSSTPTP